MTEFNLILLRQVVEWVEEQAALPERDTRWYQGDWHRLPEPGVSEESFCVSTYICHLMGVDVPRLIAQFDMEEAADYWLFDYDAWHHLGIDEDEALALFDPSNNAERIRRFAQLIARRRGHEL